MVPTMSVFVATKLVYKSPGSFEPSVRTVFFYLFEATKLVYKYQTHVFNCTLALISRLNLKQSGLRRPQVTQSVATPGPFEPFVADGLLPRFGH